MSRKLTAIFAALLAVLLLFAACAPGQQVLQPSAEPTETEAPLSIVTDAPTDNAPVEERTTSPPETTAEADAETDAPTDAETAAALDADGSYTSKEDVALYIYTYGELPQNFITKKQAEALGWTGGSLEKYAPGKCIGGGKFGNYEGLLPTAPGRVYYECDIDTLGAKSRGAKRIVYSNDGLIYYTGDHYESFTLLYGNAS